MCFDTTPHQAAGASAPAAFGVVKKDGVHSLAIDKDSRFDYVPSRIFAAII
jgi:hypothetical protein